MSRVVISDTSPLCYLILIDHADLLPTLYGEVFIPEAVANELNQTATPETVLRWFSDRPVWLQVVTAAKQPTSVSLPDLDAGEHDAILVALQMKADLVLMDERDGVEAARQQGLTVTGTLGVLDRAAEVGLIDLKAAIDRLRQTNFRVDPSLLERLLKADADRKHK